MFHPRSGGPSLSLASPREGNRGKKSHETCAACGIAAAGALAPAQAADYPTKPIRIVVPYGPGGATDIVARILGEHLKEKFRQPVVVENKPGGNGIVALQETVRAKPDGYTFLIGNITTNLLMPLIGDPPMPFDPFKDLVPVGAAQPTSPAYSSRPRSDFPPNTVQEVVDYARARPGEVNHLTAGILAYSHIDFLMLQKRTGIKLVAIPLRAGAGGGQIDLINGAVQIALQNAATVTPLVKAGKLKALAVTSEQRPRCCRRAHHQGSGLRGAGHQCLERHVRSARGAEGNPPRP